MSTRARGSTWRGSAPSTVRSMRRSTLPAYGPAGLPLPARETGDYGRSVTERIAVFPLGHVLMPGAALPLHIFEPRYQAMIADLLPSTPPGFWRAVVSSGHGDLRERRVRRGGDD